MGGRGGGWVGAPPRLFKKYDVLFQFFQVMPGTWAPALNDFVFTPWVAHL